MTNLSAKGLLRASSLPWLQIALPKQSPGILWKDAAWFGMTRDWKHKRVLINATAQRECCDQWDAIEKTLRGHGRLIQANMVRSREDLAPLRERQEGASVCSPRLLSRAAVCSLLNPPMPQAEVRLRVFAKQKKTKWKDTQTTLKSRYLQNERRETWRTLLQRG